MSELNTVPTDVNDLEIGMYVTALDRPWIETPFLVEGFYITSHADIAEVEKHCRFVYVDIYRSKVSVGGRRSSRVLSRPGAKRAPVAAPRAGSQEDPGEEAKFRSRSAKTAGELFPHRKLKPYEDTATFAQELPLAKPAYAAAVGAYRRMTERFRARGELDVSGVREAANPLVESMVRNPDACMWLARIRDEAGYAHGHPVGACIWAVAFGRRLGLPLVDLQRLALGGLLFDIGKLKIPEDLLRKRQGLSSGEFHLIKSHVDFGLEMLRGTGLLNRTITDMVQFHHERHGGHGYPQGARGEDIPIFGRIAGIVDCYDAITSRRSHAPAMSPSHAVKKMFAWRDIDFQADLVEEFIQAIGVFPAGTLLELSSGEVGVAVAGYRTQRLRPQLLLVLDSAKQPLNARRLLDLASVTQDAAGNPLEVATSLEPGAYGVNPEDLMI
jgi:HD-GYP domain-containing protein (c-di-GMP phosphodiesterase class II)